MASIIGITIDETRAAEFGSALGDTDWPRDSWPCEPTVELRLCPTCWRELQRLEGELCSACEREAT